MIFRRSGSLLPWAKTGRKAWIVSWAIEKTPKLRSPKTPQPAGNRLSMSLANPCSLTAEQMMHRRRERTFGVQSLKNHQQDKTLVGPLTVRPHP
jgi:hypothetical protein